MRLLYTLGVSLLAFAMMACPKNQPLEMTARDGIAAAKGYLDSARAKHPECVMVGSHAVPTETKCALIFRGVAAKDLAIDALDAYCSSEAYQHQGGKCEPHADARPKLEAALANMDDVVKQVKAVAGVQ